MRDIGKLSIFLLALFLPSAAAAGAAPNCQPLRRLMTLDMVPHRAAVPLIPVSLAGKRTRLIVDTGAFWSFLFQGVVRELNLTPIPVNVRVYGINGVFSDKAVNVRNFMLGPVSAGDRQFMIDPNSDPADVIGENDPAGLLGAELLSAFDVDFDFAGGKFTLFDSNHCEGQVAYWQPASLAVIPFRMEDRSHITFPVLINGKRATAVLDTGATNTIINQREARRIFGFDPNGPDVEQTGQLEGTQTAAIYRTRIEKIELEGLVINNPMLTVMPDVVGQASGRVPIGSLIPVPGAQLPDLLLGMSVLSKLHVYIAYKERRLYVSAAAPVAETPAAAPAPQ